MNKKIKHRFDFNPKKTVKTVKVNPNNKAVKNKVVKKEAAKVSKKSAKTCKKPTRSSKYTKSPINGFTVNELKTCEFMEEQIPNIGFG